MKLSYYAIQVATNMEDKVQKAICLTLINMLKDHIDNKNVFEANELRDDFGIDKSLTDYQELEDFIKQKVVLVPKEKVEEIKNGKKRETERKIFPGYVFIQMNYTDDYGLLIRKTSKVSGFVGVAKDSKPVPISQKEIDTILQQVEQSKEKAKHKVEFEVGEKIRVIDGPFVDFNATIEEVIYAKTKLRVNVQIFGRETSVDLDFGQVEKTI